MLYKKNLLKDWHCALVDGMGLQEIYFLPMLSNEELTELIEGAGYVVTSDGENGNVVAVDLNNEDQAVYRGSLEAVSRLISPKLYKFGVAALDDNFQTMKDWEDFILRQAAEQWHELSQPAADFPGIFHGIWEHELFHRVLSATGEL